MFLVIFVLLIYHYPDFLYFFVFIFLLLSIFKMLLSVCLVSLMPWLLQEWFLKFY